MVSFAARIDGDRAAVARAVLISGAVPRERPPDMSAREASVVSSRATTRAKASFLKAVSGNLQTKVLSRGPVVSLILGPASWVVRGPGGPRQPGKRPQNPCVGGLLGVPAQEAAVVRAYRSPARYFSPEST